MAVFSRNPSEREDLDWRLFQSGPIVLYYKLQTLEEDVEWLSNHGYRVYRVDCSKWTTFENVHDDFAQAMSFPDYYGRNLNALKDCLGDIEIPEEGGVCVVLKHYDAFSKGVGASTPQHSNRSDAEAVLDVLARNSRSQMLFGSRFITLVQCDDPRIRFDSLGCADAHWNPKEWLNSKRGI